MHLEHFINCRSIRFYKVDKGRNKGIVLVFGAIPLRILRHRGWTNLIYTRLMVQSEVDFVQQARRYPAYKYKDLESLFIDELNVLGDSKDFEIESKTLCDLYNTTLDDVFNQS